MVRLWIYFKIRTCNNADRLGVNWKKNRKNKLFQVYMVKWIKFQFFVIEIMEQGLDKGTR